MISFGCASAEVINRFRELVRAEGSVPYAITCLLKRQELLTKRHKFDPVDKLMHWTVDLPKDSQVDLDDALSKLDDFVRKSRLESRAAALEELINGAITMVDSSTQTPTEEDESHTLPSIAIMNRITETTLSGDSEGLVCSEANKVNLKIIVEEDVVHPDSDRNDCGQVYEKHSHFEKKSLQNHEAHCKSTAGTYGTTMKRRRGRPKKVDASEGMKINPVCDVCGKSFSTMASLSQHSSVHTGERPFVCHVCGRSFRQKGAMIDHARIHSNTKEFECEICGQQFRLRRTLREHFRSHTGEKPYKCEVCSATFGRAINLRQHASLHTGEKNFKCSFCDKTFRKWSNRQKHERTHSGEKPYSCLDCGKAFSQRYNMKVHRRKTHPETEQHVTVVCADQCITSQGLPT